MKKFLLLLLFVPLLSFGQAATYPANFDRFMALTTGLSSQTLGFASNGSPVPTTAYAGTGARVGNLGVFPDAVAGSKGLEVRGGASLPFGKSGVTVPVTAVGKVSAASLGKAFGALAGLAGGWPGLVAMVGIPFVMEWMTNSGVSGNASGFLVDQQQIASGGYDMAGVTTGLESQVAACSSLYARACGISGNNQTGGYCAGVIRGGAGMCYEVRAFAAPSALHSYVYTGAWYAGQTLAVSKVSATVAGVQAALALVQPNAWVLSELYNKAVLDNQIDLNIVAAGPASVTGPLTTINTPAVGATPASVTTTATNYNCTYVMATTSCTESQTVTKDGVVTQTQTKPAEAQPLTDCEKRPTNIGCSEYGTPGVSDPINKKTTAVSISPVSFLSVSACPSPLSFSVIGHSYGFSYQPLCDRLAMLKFLFLAMAGFVAAWSLASLFKV